MNVELQKTKREKYNEYHRKLYRRNIDKIRKQKKIYYQKEETKERLREYRLKNKEKLSKYHHNYYLNYTLNRRKAARLKNIK